MCDRIVFEELGVTKLPVEKVLCKRVCATKLSVKELYERVLCDIFFVKLWASKFHSKNWMSKMVTLATADVAKCPQSNAKCRGVTGDQR